MKLKSKNYQYKIVEVAFDQMKLNNFSESKGMAGILSDNSYSEELLDLREQLLEEVYTVVNSELLTDHQKKSLIYDPNGKDSKRNCGTSWNYSICGPQGPKRES